MANAEKEASVEAGELHPIPGIGQFVEAEEQLPIDHDNYCFKTAVDRFMEAQGYILGKLIGRGAMAGVLAATRVYDDVALAAKIYIDRGEAAYVDQEIKGLAPYYEAEHEAYRAVGKHRFILKMLDFGSIEIPLPSGGIRRFMYLIVERGERSLRDELGKRTTLPGEEVVEIAEGLARALDHIDRKGYLHQDIKPGNIILVDGIWKLADFSIAYAKNPMLTSNTPEYSPPSKDQLREVAPSPRDEFFTLGATMYELLTGVKIDPKEKKRGLHRPPSRYRKARPAGDRVVDLKTLDRICLGCLHPNPYFGYELAADLVADLGHCRNGDSIRLPIEPGWRRLGRRVGTRPIASTFLAIMFAAVVTFILYQYQSRWSRLVVFDRDFQGARENFQKEVQQAAQPLVDVVTSFKTANSVDDDDIARIRKIHSRGAAHAARSLVFLDLARKLKNELPPDELQAGTNQWFQDMIRSGQALESQYRILGEDLELYERFEKVRQRRLMTLVLRRRKNTDVRFKFGALAKEYAELFRDGLGIDPKLKTFDVETEARRLEERPGRRQYAAFLTDWAFLRAESIVESWRNAFEMPQVEQVRMLSERIDDQKDVWTQRFHRAFRPNPAEMIIPGIPQIYRKLAEDADPAVVPVSKLTIVAEVVWDTNLDAAIQFLERVRKVHSNDLWVNYLLAEMLADRGGPEDLAAELELRLTAYLQQKPPTAIVCWLLGDAHFRQGNAKKAAVYFQEAFERDKDDSLRSFKPPNQDHPVTTPEGGERSKSPA